MVFSIIEIYLLIPQSRHFYPHFIGKQTRASGWLKSRGQQTFSVKGQIVNILDFGGHVVFVTAAQHCFERERAATDNWSTNVPVKLDKNRQWVVVCGALVIQVVGAGLGPMSPSRQHDCINTWVLRSLA